MVLKGSPIENATTMEEIEDSVFGAQIGTTSLSFINTVIQPTVDPGVRLHERREGRAPERGRRRLVLDLPTAYFEATINTPNGALVGQFPNAGEYLGILFEEVLVECVNLALAEMTADGTLEDLQSSGWPTTWPSP